MRDDNVDSKGIILPIAAVEFRITSAIRKVLWYRSYIITYYYYAEQKAMHLEENAAEEKAEGRRITRKKEEMARTRQHSPPKNAL